VQITASCVHDIQDKNIGGKPMNIHEKVQKIKLELLGCNLKKSGSNKFSGFKYYELGDFMPHIIRLCEKHKVCTQITFHNDMATLDGNSFVSD
jgi:hypothetical protein